MEISLIQLDINTFSDNSNEICHVSSEAGQGFQGRQRVFWKLNKSELLNLKKSIVDKKSILLPHREALEFKDQVEGTLHDDDDVKAVIEAFAKAVIENNVDKHEESLENLDIESQAPKVVENDQKILESLKNLPKVPTDSRC